MEGGLDRRTFLKGVTLLTPPGLLGLRSAQPGRLAPVPNSAGIDVPKLTAPLLACDCHIHIYDPRRFPIVPSPRVPPTDAGVPQYRLLQRRLGTRRVVVVTPRNDATENAVTLDAVAQLGSGARGVAVLHPTVTDEELIDRGHTWVKLSGAYMNSRGGAPYADVTPVARALVDAAPERLVWGSDWPHPTEPEPRQPNDALLFDLLTEWAPHERTREAVLVSNPAALYGFNATD